MAKITAEEFAALEVKFPPKFGKPGVMQYDADDLDGSFAFKRPDRRQLGIYTKHMAEKDPVSACEFLALACVVAITVPGCAGDSPRAQLSDLLDTLPGLPLRFTETFNILAGTAKGVEGEA